MRTVFQLLFFTVLSLTCTSVFAQARYNVSGIVTNEKGEPLKSATVFIGGSERVTATDEDGRFKFAGVPQGTFQLSVQMLGYAPLTRNIIVQSAPLNLEMQLTAKSITLNAVSIGRKSAWDKNLKLFKETFLGTSDNAKQCVILNPKVINFSTKKGLLLADADDFLIIENKRLGYRLHYQLKDFGYNSKDDIALYHGECNFEELDGTDDQKKEWAKNRLEAYQGSFMHFLRSVYSNKTLENGFITRPLYGYPTLTYDDAKLDFYKVIIVDQQVNLDTLVTPANSSLISFKFNQLYVIYDPQKAAIYHGGKTSAKKNIAIGRKASLLKLSTKEAIIDQKGNYTDYGDFYIHGEWAKARVGDQLPVEYEPPFVPIVARDNPADKLVANLQKWTDSIPQEKTYLHMDKPYYALGDTIWFKGYLTIGSRHQLSALSGAVYVDLISEKDSVLRSLKLPVTTGMVIGDFILGDDLKEGSYRIRAYTQWMRNAGEDYFFDRTFTVGDIANNNIVTKADYQYKDIDGKPVLTATLNYSNDEGKPLAGAAIHYQILINKKVAWSTSAKTDLNGSIPVKISNENHVDLSGAYITTTLDGSDKNTITRDFPIKAALSQSDVQFFPESGSLVNGVSSRVAFKAVGIDGLGVNIKGKIIDNENKEVADIETLHAGMGSFLLKPEAGKTYNANIGFADGTTKIIALPKAIDEGYVLSVYQPNKDSVLIRISTPITQVAQQTLSFIAHTNGETVFASPIKIEKAVTSIWLEKQSFPTGIAQFTLFDSNNQPMNERIAFIRSTDQLQLNISTAKSSYKSKEQIQVNLEAKDSKAQPTLGNFSVSVIDKSKVPDDETNESTIFSNILLTSDLEGYIEKPNYYFANETDEVDKALDNLMLTQGYRRFTWKELNNITDNKPQFLAEGLLTTLSGKVTTLNDKPLPNATVGLLSVKANIFKNVTTDAAGKFKFDGIFLTDSIKFTLQAKAANGSNKVKLIMDNIPDIKITKNKNLGDVNLNINSTLLAYIDNGKKQDELYEKTGQLNKVQRLKEVRIKAKKNVAPTYAMQGMLQIPEGHSDKTVVLKDIEHAATLGVALQGLLGNVRFGEYQVSINEIPILSYPYALDHRTMAWVPMSIIVDGRLLPIEEVPDVFSGATLALEDIVKIEVVTSNQAVLATLGTGPALLIYTNRGMLRKNYNPSIVNITPKGFNKAREFYSPKYNKPSDADKLPDLRSTVYWNPNVKTDATGKGSFNFFNADGPGTYRVVIEGINAEGELGRQVYNYTVK